MQPGAELQRPMALAVLGGMAVSTMFTLFVVPAAYVMIDDVVEWNVRRRRRGQGLGSGLGEVWAGMRGRATQWRSAHMRTREGASGSS